MREVEEAIFNRYNSGGSFHDAVTKLRFGWAEPKDVLPYAVYHIISNTPDWQFGDTYYENVRVQFSLFSESNSSTEVEQLYTYLKELYDWCTLVVTGYTCLYMRRVSASLTRDTTYNVWQYNVDYEVMLDKN